MLIVNNMVSYFLPVSYKAIPSKDDTIHKLYNVGKSLIGIGSSRHIAEHS
jgi:hypothetical protein